MAEARTLSLYEYQALVWAWNVAQAEDKAAIDDGDGEGPSVAPPTAAEYREAQEVFRARGAAYAF